MIKASCPEAELKANNLSSTCRTLVQEMKQEIGSYYSYNLYDTCYSENIFEPRSYWSSHPQGMDTG